MKVRCAVFIPAILLLSSAGVIEGETIVVPARSFSSQGGGEVFLSQKETVPSHIHFWYTPGHWVEWDIDIEKEGIYRLAVAHAGCFLTRRKVEVYGSTPPQGEEIVLRKTGDWHRFVEEDTGASFSLRKGKNTLRITCLDDASVCVSSLILVPASEGAPEVIEGVRYAREGGGKVQKVVSDEHGYFTHWDKPGHWLEWKVTAEEEGKYDVTLLYSALKYPVRRVEVNGSLVAGMGAVKLPSTGGWRNWSEARLPVPVTLPKGTSTVRMTCISESMNLTALIVEGKGERQIIPAIAFSRQGVLSATTSGSKSEEEVSVRTHMSASERDAVRQWDRGGHWLQWEFTAPQTATFSLVLVYRARQETVCRIEVNGRVLDGCAQLVLPSTGDTDLFAERTVPVPITLNKGHNAIRITNLADKELCLGRLILSPAGVR